MSSPPEEKGRGVVKLVVASPDGSRVLARPNGLAGWTLPTIALSLPVDAWSPEAAARAEAVLGTPVEAQRRLGPDAWEVVATGRVTAAGNTWIGVDEAARLGADEAVVRRWAAGTADRPSARRDGQRRSGECG